MKVFILGIAGGIGQRVARRLVKRGDHVTGLVRRVSQGDQLARVGIPTVLGDLVAMSVDGLAAAMRGSDAIVFTAGAGGRDGREATTLVDGDGPGKLAVAAEIAGVRRFLLVSVFPEAWRERQMPVDFEHYMAEKKKAETKIVLTGLNWIIVRPSALTNDPGEGRVDLGPAKVHFEITRDDVSDTIVELLRRPDINRVILELTGGITPIDEAMATISRCTSTAVRDRLHNKSP